MQTCVSPLHGVKSGWLLAPEQTALVPEHLADRPQSDVVEHTLLVCENEQSDSQHAPWDGLQLEPVFSWHVWLLQHLSVQSAGKPQSHCSPESTIPLPHIDTLGASINIFIFKIKKKIIKYSKIKYTYETKSILHNII